MLFRSRNTAPAIALAAAYLTANGADPVMVVLPADHIIKDEVQFRAHLDIAIKAAESGKLVTFGIQPTRPDTGFGYIKTGLRTEVPGLSDKTTTGVAQSSVLEPQSCPPQSSALAPQSCMYAVERFTEKPDLATAERFLKEGNYYWNSGMFVWRASVILAEIKRHLPEVDRKSTRLNSSHERRSRMPSSA